MKDRYTKTNIFGKSFRTHVKMFCSVRMASNLVIVVIVVCVLGGWFLSGLPHLGGVLLTLGLEQVTTE
jgi:hypothetical protein